MTLPPPHTLPPPTCTMTMPPLLCTAIAWFSWSTNKASLEKHTLPSASAVVPRSSATEMASGTCRGVAV